MTMWWDKTWATIGPFFEPPLTLDIACHWRQKPNSEIHRLDYRGCITDIWILLVYVRIRCDQWLTTQWIRRDAHGMVGHPVKFVRRNDGRAVVGCCHQPLWHRIVAASWWRVGNWRLFERPDQLIMQTGAIWSNECTFALIPFLDADNGRVPEYFLYIVRDVPDFCYSQL
jgi:hypothetical protein